jgi:hypothetical protein
MYLSYWTSIRDLQSFHFYVPIPLKNELKGRSAPCVAPIFSSNKLFPYEILYITKYWLKASLDLFRFAHSHQSPTPTIQQTRQQRQKGM